MHLFFNCTTKNTVKMAKTLIEFAKWRPTQNLLFGRLHFMIYTHNRFGRFVLSFYLCVYWVYLLLICVRCYCCMCEYARVCVRNLKHTHTYSERIPVCLRFVWCALALAFTGLSMIWCVACVLYAVSVAPVLCVLALLLLLLWSPPPPLLRLCSLTHGFSNFSVFFCSMFYVQSTEFVFDSKIVSVLVKPIHARCGDYNMCVRVFVLICTCVKRQRLFE